MITAKTIVIGPAAALLLACSSSRGGHDANPTASDGGTGDDLLVVPNGLTIAALPGGNGVLEVVALTLRRGPSNIELYAALKNNGDVPACDPALSVELFDHSQRSIAAVIGGLYTTHFYRLADGSGTVAACASPGDITMAELNDLPSDIQVDDVGYVVYRCPYFALDVVQIDGLDVSGLGRVARGEKTAYAGTLRNDLDVPVSNPSVTVFPVNGVGRPMGVATGSDTRELQPGSSWAFETTSVDESAVGYVAYPAGAFAN